MLLFFGAAWDANSMVYANFTLPTPDVKAAIRRIDRHSTPTIAIYHPDMLDSPVILDGLPSAEQITDACDTPTSSPDIKSGG